MVNVKSKMTGEMVRQELRSRGWMVKDLADRIGVSSRYLSNLLAGNTHSGTAKIQVEWLLGRAFWSTEEEFAARQRDGEATQSAAGEQKRQGNV